MDFHKLYGLVNQLLREFCCPADGFHQREPLVVLGHCFGKLQLALNCFIQPSGKVGILLIVGFLGKGIFLFIENAFREVLIEPGAFLGDAAEFQIQACNERILLIADAAFAFAVSQLGKQLVVIESCLDLKLDCRKYIGFELILPRIMRRTEITALDG